MNIALRQPLRLLTPSQINNYLTLGPIWGKILREIYFDIKQEKVKNTLEIDSLYREKIEKKFVDYSFPFTRVENIVGDSFPYSVCCSVNNVAAHGIPNKHPLQTGDIVSADFGLQVGDINLDAQFTATCGRQDEDWVLAPLRAIKKIAEYKPATTYQIASVIEVVAKEHGLDIVASLCGHGIGSLMHMAPIVYNLTGDFFPVEIPENFAFCPEPTFTKNEKENTQISTVMFGQDQWSMTANDLTSNFETVLLNLKGHDVYLDVVGITLLES